MAIPLPNMSFDGSPVYFRMDSPLLLRFDPVALDMIRDRLASFSTDDPVEASRVPEQVNVKYSAMSCYQIGDFQPGVYTLSPQDIQKFGDEDEDLDYNEAEEDEKVSPDLQVHYPFVGVDSGALIIADFAHVSQLVNLLTWEQYDLGLQDESVFGKITDALGGPYFALIIGGIMPGMEFDGDGTYTIKAGAVRPNRG
jgi:hypothetical protein